MSEEVRFDWQREARTRIPEVVLAEGKSSAQLRSILAEAEARSTSVLFTRLDAETAQAFDVPFDYDPLSRTGWNGRIAPPVAAPLAIVAAGSSDVPIAREAQRTLAFLGLEAPLIADIGVAGLWRLEQRLGELRGCRVIIACAGMEGALFSVLAGLVPALVIAVPTPLGYGAGAGGKAALGAALASCAPGIVTVNIGNGFGAACAAAKILRG